MCTELPPVMKRGSRRKACTNREPSWCISAQWALLAAWRWGFRLRATALI